VLDSVAKIVAAGGDFRKVYLTFQEYFPCVNACPHRWGKPLAALLGAYHAQTELGIAAIGGKDSMSGSYEALASQGGFPAADEGVWGKAPFKIDVPPTLISFAATAVDSRKVISGEFKEAGRRVMLIDITYNDEYIPDFALAMKLYDEIHKQIYGGKVYSAYALGAAGICEAVKMCFGNDIGIDFGTELDLFKPRFGSIVLEVTDDFEMNSALLIGKTLAKIKQGFPAQILGFGVKPHSIQELRKAWEKPLADIFPSPKEETPVLLEKFSKRNESRSIFKTAKPRVFIPVFPGTNCEYDSAKAFERRGAIADIFVINNMTCADIEQSIIGLVKGINNSQIMMLAGGFSAGDEPDGSAKFIATAFRNPRVKEAADRLLNQRDGLILGICNGFQALVKLGLVPYGEIKDTLDIEPTLTYNTIGRHISCMAKTEIVSTLSPWLMYHDIGEQHIIPISHGEGRFVVPQGVIEKLTRNGQIATQYVDSNPNGSINAIEGITSPDGRVFGKMGHSERCGVNVAKNIIGNKEQQIFKAGVDYFG
jgi:phosphoribosylformylglycinamidine synthase